MVANEVLTDTWQQDILTEYIGADVEDDEEDDEDIPQLPLAMVMHSTALNTSKDLPWIKICHHFYLYVWQEKQN